MPYYVLINKAPFTIECQEDQRSGDPWLKIEPDKSVPFWPKTSANKMMRVKTADESAIARSFNYTEVQNTLLKLENKVRFYFIIFFLFISTFYYVRIVRKSLNYKS